MNPILFNNEVSPGYRHMSIAAPELAQKAKPGQFVMISVRDGRVDPILRRPMGIMLVEKGKNGHIEILYQVVGRGTVIMSRMKEGELIDVIGPFGNGFDLPQDRDVWIVTGGCGTAPFFEVAKHLSRNLEKGKEIRIFQGGRASCHILCTDIFRKYGVEPEIATEDGSLGSPGLVTELLEKALSTLNGSQNKPLILASGPFGMLKAIAGLAEKYDVECQVSIDKRMACGFGVCLGCVVPVKNPDVEIKEGDGHTQGIQYKCVCSDGPVFDSKEILW